MKFEFLFRNTFQYEKEKKMDNFSFMKNCIKQPLTHHYYRLVILDGLSTSFKLPLQTTVNFQTKNVKYRFFFGF